MTSPTPRRICFVIMPYGRKPTGLEAGKGPASVDFDALWNKALRPLLEEDLGYDAVRADQELGALIIEDMIERLALSDVVIADVTIANANVYYEVGVRHAAHKCGCVLIAATWAQPVFDLQQMRQVRYPLPSGDATDDDAAAIREALRERVKALAEGPSPVWRIVPGYPSAPSPGSTATFKERVRQITEIVAQIAAVHRAPAGERAERAVTVSHAYREAAQSVPAVAQELVLLLRDTRQWADVVSFIDGLPPATRDAPFFQEQYHLARAKTGSALDAVAALETLIATSGDSSERRGLLGGRYKQLYDDARDADAANDAAQYLSAAIDEYRRGMQLDLNDYYPSSNLPRLLRARGEDGDEAEAQTVATLTALACQRALARTPSDKWAQLALLGAAFDAGDVATARAHLQKVKRLPLEAFEVETIVRDLAQSVELQRGAPHAAALGVLVDELRALLPPPPASAT